MIARLLVVALFVAHPVSAIAQTATANGNCNIVISGSNNAVDPAHLQSERCGFAKDQLDKIIKLLNITLTKKDAAEITAKLNELIEVAGRGQRTTVNAPITQQNSGGCNQQVVGGNNNTNTCVPPERNLVAEDDQDLHTILERNSAVVNISAPAGDNEAQGLGVQLYKLFQSSGWTMKNPIVMSYMKVGGPVVPGITVFIHGDPVAATTTLNLPDNDPLLLIKQMLEKENLLCGFQRRNGTSEGVIDIEIGTAPFPK